DKAARDLVDRIKEHDFALVVHVEALLDEVVVVQNAFVQGPGVFGEAECGKHALFFGEVNRINARVADRHCGPLGVDIDRSDVEAEFRLGRKEQEFADSTHGYAGRGAKAHGNPVGVEVFLQVIFRAADLEYRTVGSADHNFEWEPEVAARRLKWV